MKVFTESGEFNLSIILALHFFFFGVCAITRFEGGRESKSDENYVRWRDLKMIICPQFANISH